MRYKFAEVLESLMAEDDRVFFLTGDLGYKIFDKILEKYPDRAFTVGASEQMMLAMAVGLADSGKIPFVYSITPFLLYRPFEIIRNYLDHEKINVKLIGCGRDSDYEHDGFTHYAGDDAAILKCFNNIECFWPSNCEEMITSMKYISNTQGAKYLNLIR